MEKFWIVWSPGGSNPAVRHNSLELAALEAHRLATKHKNMAFYVMEVMSITEATSVKTTYI